MLPFPPPGDLPNPGIEPISPALAGWFFTTEPPGKSGQPVVMSIVIIMHPDRDYLWETTWQGHCKVWFAEHWIIRKKNWLWEPLYKTFSPWVGYSADLRCSIFRTYRISKNMISVRPCCKPEVLYIDVKKYTYSFCFLVTELWSLVAVSPGSFRIFGLQKFSLAVTKNIPKPNNPYRIKRKTGRLPPHLQGMSTA